MHALLRPRPRHRAPRRARLRLHVARRALAVAPGTTVRFLLTVENQGRCARDARISCHGAPSGWRVTLGPDPLPVAKRSKEFAALRIDVPLDAPLGTRETLRVREAGGDALDLEVVVAYAA